MTTTRTIRSTLTCGNCWDDSGCPYANSFTRRETICKAGNRVPPTSNQPHRPRNRTSEERYFLTDGLRDQAEATTNATGSTAAANRPTDIGVIGECWRNPELASATTKDTDHAMTKAIQNILRGPRIGSVLETAEIRMPAIPGPQVARKAKGSQRNRCRLMTAFQEKPRPQVIVNVAMKNATT